MPNWTTSQIPSQKGRTAIVTGTGGLGLEAALALAKAGAEVIVAGRNPDKGKVAIDKVRAEAPAATVQFEPLDLADLSSVAAFASRMRSSRTSLDLLINNAAVMTPPNRQQTVDGFELQFGTNYLSHFALTAHLRPLLSQGSNARVVTLSSIAARQGALDFDDLQAEKNYNPMRAYSQSKLACLMFAFELQRRSEAGGWGIASIAAHPGLSRTDLLHNAPGRWSPSSIMRSLLWWMFQPAAQGALPTLFAATSPDATPGAYYGPDKMNEIRGFPTASQIPPQAEDQTAAQRLWQISEQLTGLTF